MAMSSAVLTTNCSAAPGGGNPFSCQQPQGSQRQQPPRGPTGPRGRGKAPVHPGPNRRSGGFQGRGKAKRDFVPWVDAFARSAREKKAALEKEAEKTKKAEEKPLVEPQPRHTPTPAPASDREFQKFEMLRAMESMSAISTEYQHGRRIVTQPFHQQGVFGQHQPFVLRGGAGMASLPSVKKTFMRPGCNNTPCHKGTCQVVPFVTSSPASRKYSPTFDFEVMPSWPEIEQLVRDGDSMQAEIEAYNHFVRRIKRNGPLIHAFDN